MIPPDVAAPTQAASGLPRRSRPDHEPRRPLGSHYVPGARAERLIAGSRMVLATFSLLAIWLDPMTPASRGELTYALLASYLAYAAILMAVTWRVKAPQRLGVVTHCVDLTLFSIFLYLTDGFASPFFVYLTFALVSATLRWQVAGVLWTAVATIAAFNLVGLRPSLVGPDGDFALNRLIIRNVYLLVITGLFAYLGAYQSRLRRTLWAAAAWPRRLGPEADRGLLASLEHAAAMLETPRILLLWESRDEPWLQIQDWRRGHLRITREPGGRLDQLVGAPFAGRTFATTDAGPTDGAVLVRSGQGFDTLVGAPLGPELRAGFGITRAVVAPLPGHHVEGFLVAEPADITVDSLVLADIVADLLTADLDNYLLSGAAQAAAAAEARVRLAGDLHDGILQGLTGAALQLQSLLRLPSPSVSKLLDRVRFVADLIEDEQQELRFLLRELRTLPVDAARRSDLEARISQLAARAGEIWGLDVRVDLARADRDQIKPLDREICCLVREGLINVGRHAHASRATVTIASADGTASIVLTDDGCGFPFRGSADHAALAANELGPRSIRERVARLGGTVTVRSRSSGAEIEILLPATTPDAVTA